MNLTRSIPAYLFTATAAFATPSGLNNIPTADTAPQGVFVFQSFTTLGYDRDADFNLGFKTGLDFKVVRFEMGAASHILPDKGGPVTVHGKVALPFGDGLPVLAIGAANIAFSEQQRQRAGDVFGYAVLSQDFGWLRAHAGCAYVDTDALPFFGLDKTFRRTASAGAPDGKSHKAMPETKTTDLFTLRADAIEQRDSSWLYSAGVLVPVCKWFVFEAWGNFPDNGDAASVTLKGNFVIKF